jgi:hypothetical protein
MAERIPEGACQSSIPISEQLDEVVRQCFLGESNWIGQGYVSPQYLTAWLGAVLYDCGWENDTEKEKKMKEKPCRECKQFGDPLYNNGYKRGPFGKAYMTMPKMARSFTDVTMDCMANRRTLFVTKSGHDGTGPLSTKEGDTINYISGVPLPMILRPKESTNAFEVIGPAIIAQVCQERMTLDAAKLERIDLV